MHSSMENPTHQTLALLCTFFIIISTFSPSLADDRDDDYMFPPAPRPPPSAPCNKQDRFNLLAIKKALNNTNLLASWRPNTDCCNGWDSVICDPATGRVATLSFYGNGLGRNNIPPVLPAAVGNLTALRSLSFFNNVTGPIPTALKNLKRLQSLYLSHNRFTGAVPAFLSEMKSLAWLQLSGNKLSGPVPAALAQSSSLYVIKLDNNSLSGPIPDALGKFVTTHPVVLDLSNNKLSGPLPPSFANANFRSLFLSKNKLTGDASFLFGKKKRLWELDLSENWFSFNMSNVEIPSQLNWLGLNKNDIYGGLPVGLKKAWLLSFNVSGNQLCGPIPQGSTLQQFGASAFSDNKCLCGNPLSPCVASV